MPKKPFAQDALIPDPQQWLVTPLWYQYTEFQRVWRGAHTQNITFPEGHGFDQNDAIFNVEYGIRKRWAADFQTGFTDLATRAYSDPPGIARHTRGLMDTTFGVRYEIWRESEEQSCYLPTLTVRAGGIYRGSYQKSFPYAPGNGGVGLETSVLMLKDFHWNGLGAYATSGYRAIRSGGPDQYFGTVGVSQYFRGATLNAGYRHQQSLGGGDVGGFGDMVEYTGEEREVNEQFEAGIGYTDQHARRWQFYFEHNFAGRNTGDKYVYGIYLTLPFGGHKEVDKDK
jgi:hypothetical protein